MTSIFSSSLIPFYASGANNASQASDNGDFGALMASRSDPNMMGIGNADQMLNSIQQFVASVENTLENIGSGSSTAQAYFGAIYANAPESTSFAESMLASGGPLPAFITRVIAERHLNATQQQALWGIAEKNMDVVKTPESVQKIALELQEAGI